ncbi:zinc-dependent alcohol dehydrogenase family protein [Levilactobacillus bambusae]|uniref:Alcohol dehydrogenase n=1 Tax=Levilactobacillus bambusae TaxID=2024736 RepID=A0A2V1N1Z6_9LACO|nr:zinc-dependent alcohol dehydrogenase family protein [Levilactobacillus bambusae]PWG00270.1 alcohol dehydrogenase [Levilactobacillus bambusae]
MKALVLTETKKMELETIDRPSVGPDEVLVKTAYAGICGTDKALYQGLPGSADAVPPIVLGHENSGVVEAVGDDVKNVKPGDHVSVDPNIYCGECAYCLTSRPELCDHLSAVGVTRNGGFEEYFTAPAKVVYRVPASLSLKAAATIEPLSCAVHGVDLLNIEPYQKALVIGDGFEGELFNQVLQAYGVRQVDMAGRNREKLALNQKQFNVTTTYELYRDEIPAEYDIVIEAVGRPETQEMAIAATKKGAQVLMFGVGAPNQTFPVNTYDVFAKQLKIQGSFINPYTFMASIALLESGKVNPLPLINTELTLDNVEDFVSGQMQNVNKAVVKVGGDLN